MKYVKVESLSRNELKFQSLIRAELKRMGFRVSADNAGRKIGGNAGNLYVHVRGKVEEAPRILLNAHIDTVVPGTDIKPRIRSGKIVSNGHTILGADNKAGVAAIMEALQTIKEKKMICGDILIIFTVAEEIGLSGSKFVKRHFIKQADFGFVMDGGDVNEIINKAPSQDSISIKITGKAAHAGVHPEKGINAIKVAGEAVSKMRLGRIDSETTANIGIISGGLATNIVPEAVIMKGEARSHSRIKLARQVAHMKKVLRSTCDKYGAKLEFRPEPSYRSFEVNTSHQALSIARRAVASVGMKPKIRATGGGSDANIFNSLGLPCVIMGVGADSVHTKKENLPVDKFISGTEMLLNVVKESAQCKKKQ